MKKLFVISSLLIAISIKAQTVSNSVPSFFSTAQSYFTSFNTNLLTFQDGYDHFDLTTGAENWNNSQLLATFHGDAHIYSLTTNQSIRAVATFYNDTTLGSLSKLDGGVAYSYSLWDTKTTLSLNSGYDWDIKKTYIRPDLKFEKSMTQHTFAGINIGLPIYLQGQGRLTPNYGFDAGFNF